MGVKYNPFTGGLELTAGTPVYMSNGAPPNDTESLWVDTSNTVKDASPYILQTGSVIRFDRPIIFNTPTSPSTSWEITHSLADAQHGFIQKIYHKSPVTPKFPEQWVLMRDTSYLRGALNIIYAEWVSDLRIEYWFVQEFGAVYREISDYDGTYYCPQQTPDYTITYDIILEGG